MRRILPVAVLAGALASFGLGCGPSMSKVECKVTLNGEPVAGATVTFLYQGETTSTKIAPTGHTDANGVCQMMTGSKEGVEKGSYKVTVTKSAGANLSEEDRKDPTKAMSAMFGGGSKAGGAAEARPEGGAAPGAPKRPPAGGGGAPGGAGGARRPGGPGGGQEAKGMRPVNELPPQYGDVAQTPLKVDVPTTGQVTLSLTK